MPGWPPVAVLESRASRLILASTWQGSVQNDQPDAQRYHHQRITIIAATPIHQWLCIVATVPIGVGGNRLPADAAEFGFLFCHGIHSATAASSASRFIW